MTTLNTRTPGFSPALLLATGAEHAGRAVECGDSPDWYLQLYPGQSVVLRCADGGENDDVWWEGWNLQNLQDACEALEQACAPGLARALEYRLLNTERPDATLEQCVAMARVHMEDGMSRNAAQRRVCAVAALTEPQALALELALLRLVGAPGLGVAAELAAERREIWLGLPG